MKYNFIHYHNYKEVERYTLNSREEADFEITAAKADFKKRCGQREFKGSITPDYVSWVDKDGYEHYQIEGVK